MKCMLLSKILFKLLTYGKDTKKLFKAKITIGITITTKQMSTTLCLLTLFNFYYVLSLLV